MSKTFKKLDKAAAFHTQRDGSRNHCAVIALAAAAGVSFGKAAIVLRDQGRTDITQGTSVDTLVRGATELGLRVSRQARIVGGTAQRFAADTPKGMFFVITTGHVACVKDGELVDHEKGQRKKIVAVLEISHIHTSQEQHTTTHTSPTRHTGTKTMQSIMQNRGNARIWLQDLAAYGWAAGKAYTVLIDGDTITIKADPTSKRKVGKSKGGIIDLTNRRITEWAMRVQATHVDFTYYNDRIIISVARQH